MPSNLPHRPAFTLVELLVVITIIGMLMALLMPAVNAAREAMNRSSCENNQAQLAKAVLEYETANKHYPGYANAGDQSWAEVLLPNLGRNDMASSGTRTYLPTMVCPSDKAPDATGTPTSYVVNCGLADSGSFDYKANGVFHDHTNATVVKIDSGYIQAGDGTATTLMLSENVQAWEWPRSTWGSASDGERKAGFVWRNIDPTGVIPEIYFINGQVELIGDQGVDIDDARPSSRHPGGVVVTFCDGHQKFFAEQPDDNTDIKIRFLLQTPLGAQSAVPGSGAATASYWRTTVLDEGSY